VRAISGYRRSITLSMPNSSPGAWSFVVVGDPAPQGSKTAKGYRGGRIVLVESSKRVKPWRDSVVAAAIGAGPCLDGPLVVGMVFALRRPASARKRDVAPCRYPDLSKLARSVEDAITTAGLWADDARVAIYTPLVKAFAGLPVPGLPGIVVPVPSVIVACAQLEPGAVVLVQEMLRKEAANLSALTARYSA